MKCLQWDADSSELSPAVSIRALRALVGAGSARAALARLASALDACLKQLVTAIRRDGRGESGPKEDILCYGESNTIPFQRTKVWISWLPEIRIKHEVPPK